jgi:putative ABC transport system substrate-binding protein
LAYCSKRRLPSVFSTREWVVKGGLLSYEPDATDMHRRAAEFVLKILRGRQPRDLPVEQPTRFRLTVSVKAAGTIGLTMPRSLLQQADQVIE